MSRCCRLRSFVFVGFVVGFVVVVAAVVVLNHPTLTFTSHIARQERLVCG